MRLSISLKKIIVEIICFLLIALFIYAAVSKLLDFKNFQAQLGQSPLLSAYTGFISFAVIILEIIIALLLSIPKTRLIGLFGAFSLMVMFTAYILIITNYSYYVPCSCGGILQNMEWKGHLVFNICFTIFSIIAVFFQIDSQRTHTEFPQYSFNKMRGYLRLQSPVFILGLIALISVATICVLYIYSEHAMHNENPFIRRYVQGTAIKEEEQDIKSNHLYFAGYSGSDILLGDNKAPLHILAYDSVLKPINHFKIKLSRDDFPFRSVQVRIMEPNFYLTDGTVPVIYKGNISDWKASIVSNTPQIPYFSKIEIIDSLSLVYRKRNPTDLDNILGTFHINSDRFDNPAPNLLQKQIDGFFDTDGTMHYDNETKKFVYTYFYRNQFIVTDQYLNLLYRGKTIDTTSHANIKVAFIKETGERKLASTPNIVNNLSAISGNLLFVNSRLMGRYEAVDMWETASIVDIYDLNNGKYLSSIYLYNVEKSKVNDIIIVGSNLYTIVGHYMHRYKLNKQLINGEKKNKYKQE
ncbi:hypothetical protein K6T82_18135 [Flavobacterium sp. 17A]|uniref:Methylamine utilisation protein MauE domain-containing protein n=1 Tax=Flavobacterium potami TaxID=2872310 RepID=A0A9X1HCQ3_9FLAO|nr:MauE/DoxX family redox-associated membrane protein [Flavobacterium potami]MBZ4036695.1 hypothetical protein [Flavobacterium potami]